ncbi:hypothetical protein [Mycobacterium sp. ZZG]
MFLDKVGCLGWASVLYALHERNLIATYVLRHWLWQAWIFSGNPHLAISREHWRAMFRLVGYNVQGRPAQPQSIRLYRGSPIATRYNWSWTSDLRIACQFAQARHVTQWAKGYVWTVDAPADALLCHIPHLSEYVIDTTGLVIG